MPKPGYPKQLKHLGDHIMARRIDFGLRQTDIAARLGAGKDTVRNWESLRSEPEVRFLPAVIAFLGYNPLPRPATCGQALRRRHRSLGLSHRRLAALAGVDEASVRRLESNTKGMAQRVRQSIGTALDGGPAGHGGVAQDP